MRPSSSQMLTIFSLRVHRRNFKSETKLSSARRKEKDPMLSPSRTASPFTRIWGSSAGKRESYTKCTPTSSTSAPTMIKSASACICRRILPLPPRYQGRVCSQYKLLLSNSEQDSNSRRAYPIHAPRSRVQSQSYSGESRKTPHSPLRIPPFPTQTSVERSVQSRLSRTFHLLPPQPLPLTLRRAQVERRVYSWGLAELYPSSTLAKSKIEASSHSFSSHLSCSFSQDPWPSPYSEKNLQVDQQESQHVLNQGFHHKCSGDSESPFEIHTEEYSTPRE